MRVFLQLIKINFFNFLSYNADTKKKGMKRALLQTVLIVVLLFFVSYTYSRMISGMMFIYVCCALALVMCITTGFQSASGELYEFKDYDFLVSLPIRKSVIVSTKLLAFYLVELMYSAGILLLPLLRWGIGTSEPFIYFFNGISGLLFFPLVPMALVCFISYFLKRVSSLFKHKNIAGTIISVGFFLVYTGALMSFEFSDNNEIAVKLMKVFKYLPNVDWYIRGAFDHSFGYALLADLFSLGVMALFIFFFASNIVKLNEKLKNNSYHVENFKWKNSKKNSVFSALFKKDFRTFLTSPSYILSTSVGMFFLIVGMIVLFMYSKEVKMLKTELEIWDSEIYSFAFMAVMYVGFLSPVSAVGINLEGKKLWIIKSLPLSYRDIFLSKILLNFLVVFIPSLLFSVSLGINAETELIWIILLIISSAIISLSISLISLWMNLLFPKLNADNDNAAIKNSPSLLICLFGGMIITLGLFFLYLFVFAEYLDTVQYVALLQLFLLIIDIILLVLLKKYGRNILMKL